jgi:hypothetical protein
MQSLSSLEQGPGFERVERQSVMQIPVQVTPRYSKLEVQMVAAMIELLWMENSSFFSVERTSRIAM